MQRADRIIEDFQRQPNLRRAVRLTVGAKNKSATIGCPGYLAFVRIGVNIAIGDPLERPNGSAEKQGPEDRTKVHYSVAY